MTELGRATTLDGIVDILVARRKSLGLPQRAVDDISGLADGYTAKVEAKMKGLGALSLPCLLGALGVEVSVMPMLEPQKHSNSYASASTCSMTSKNYWRRRTAKARAAALAMMTPKQKRDRARAAARARWRKVERERS